MRLPTFLIIGAQRSATTSLHYALKSHPQVFMPDRKEVDYFLRSPHGDLPLWAAHPGLVPRDLNEYAALFAAAGPEHRALGEASPGYLWGPSAVWIRAQIPDVKLIAILRHPVDQARSIWMTWTGRPPDMMELGEALLDEVTPGPDDSMPLVHHGRYYHHLLPFFEDGFGRPRFPREQIKILLLDDLEADAEGTMRELQEFIGVEPIALEVPRFNPSGRRDPVLGFAMRAKGLVRALLPSAAMERLRPLAHRLVEHTTERAEPIPPGLRAQWTEQFYGESLDRLQDLIGRDLSRWRGEPKQESVRPELEQRRIGA